MRNIEIYDTTLRDGAQTEGISFSLKDKLKIAKKLDQLGVHFIEGGWPSSNPKEIEFFKKIKKSSLKNAKLVVFGATRRSNVRVNSDSNIKSLLKAETEIVTIFGKSWALHVRDVFKIPLSENLRMIEDTIIFLKKKKLRVFFDAEHFFDGFRDNSDYALKTLKVAEEAGCEKIILCDTNGGMITSWIKEIISLIKPELNTPLGIHTHNDTSMAVANSIVAVEAGCEHIQGTINGYGERCGNADLCSIIATLKLKLNVNSIPKKNMKDLTKTSRFISEISNMRQQSNQPYVGTGAFAHKGGVHINAIMKNPRTYEHIMPDIVGNNRRLLISELSGKSTILIKAKDYSLDLNKSQPKTKKILNLLQGLEHKGYQFEAAEASFELLMRKAFGKYRKFFELKGFRVIIEKQGNNQLISEATIKLKVNKCMQHTVSEGDGPVNALDNALRKALLDSYPALSKMRLTDFKVRVLDEKIGTAAKVRVLVQSQDEKNSWGTVGVSKNIIEASWQALVNSIEYKLLKDKDK